MHELPKISPLFNGQSNIHGNYACHVAGNSVAAINFGVGANLLVAINAVVYTQAAVALLAVTVGVVFNSGMLRIDSETN